MVLFCENNGQYIPIGKYQVRRKPLYIEEIAPHIVSLATLLGFFVLEQVQVRCSHFPVEPRRE